MAKDKDEDVLVHPDPGGLLRQRTDLGIESALAFLEQVSNLVALIRNEQNLSFACPVLNQPASAQLSDCACPLRLRARAPDAQCLCRYVFFHRGEFCDHIDGVQVAVFPVPHQADRRRPAPGPRRVSPLRPRQGR
jgi:hypothetical protein